MIPLSPTVRRQKPLVTTDYEKDVIKSIVSFYPKVRLHRILSVDEYSDTEREACWYTRDELHEIRKEVDETVEIIENEYINDAESFHATEEDYCRRGLEPETEHGSTLRWNRHFQAMNAVLEEQEIQRKDSCSDEEMIALAYSKLVSDAKLDAHVRGVNDASFALLYMADSWLKPR